MTREEMEELKGLAASMGLYDDKNPCKKAVILGKAIKALEQFTWRDPKKPQKVDEYVLLSYSKYSLPDIGEYREDGKYYPGDDERSCESFGLIVDGWMPTPKVRRELGAE